MTDLRVTPGLPSLPGLPASAWCLGATSLAGQVLALADRGLSRSEEPWVLVSVALSALVVSWVSAGVLRARTGRLVVAWLVLGVVLLFSVVGTLSQLPTPSGVAALGFALSLVQLVALAMFCRSDYFRRQRSHSWPGTEPSIAGLVLIAVLVGVLGGLTAPAGGDTPPQQVRVGL
jgi:hypothetical protein